MIEDKGIIAANLPNKWTCENGHIIGMAIRDKRQGRIFTRLLLFIGALLPENIVPEGAGRCIMDAGEVVCGVCGAKRSWYAGDYLMQQLLAGRRKISS